MHLGLIRTRGSASGALIGLYAGPSRRVVAVVMALGAGVLVSSVAFELMDVAYRSGGFDAASIGLLCGALAFFVADWLVSRSGGHNRKRSQGQQSEGSATGITIGALMDGIPESIAIGVSLIGGGSVGWVMVIAVFLSNIPESLSAAAGMKKAGHSTSRILLLWSAVVLISALSSLLGYFFLAQAFDLALDHGVILLSLPTLKELSDVLSRPAWLRACARLGSRHGQHHCRGALQTLPLPSAPA